MSCRRVRVDLRDDRVEATERKKEILEQECDCEQEEGQEVLLLIYSVSNTRISRGWKRRSRSRASTLSVGAAAGCGVGCETGGLPLRSNGPNREDATTEPPNPTKEKGT